MSLVLLLAFRNLTRNAVRTALSSVAVVMGVALLILGFGMVDGLDENVLRTQIDSVSGHVILRAPSVDPDALSNEVSGLEPLPPALEQRLSAYDWTPRLLFDAWLGGGSDVFRAKGVAYDSERDSKVFRRDDFEIEGRWPEQGGVVVGVHVAELLDLKVGQTVNLQARTAQGAINALSYPVEGIVRTRNPMLDNFAVLVPMTDALELTRAAGPSLVAIRLDNRERAPEVAAALQGEWSASTFRDEARDLLALNQFRRKVIQFVVLMLMAIAATGIANTIIMAAYERVREIGTLLAMGMSPGQVRALFLTEGSAMGLLAGSLGGVLGSLANGYLSVNGVDISGAMEKTGSALAFSSIIYTSFSWTSVFFAIAFGASIAVIASWIPANMASRLNPADAIRAD